MASIKKMISKLTTSEKREAVPEQSSFRVIPPPKPDMSETPPRFLIIGAGSRGRNYAEAIDSVTNGVVAAVAEPLKFKRETLGRRHIWGDGEPGEGQSFLDWRDFLKYEQDRRRRAAAGEENVPEGVDGAFVCVLDEMHREVVVGLAPLGLHIMCEKPLACSLRDCLDMYKALRPSRASKVFSIGHVLRYSPHNMMLRRLLLEERVIGDILSVVHTEPENLTSPETVSSSGSLQFFKKSRKPKAAGDATNCTKCPLGDEGCKFSAKNIYLGPKLNGLGAGNTRWPISVVVHDIEDYPSRIAKEEVLTQALEDDYDESTPESEVKSRNWFGRCVFEADNDVCDDQRYSNIYGEHGEIYADSAKIVVEDFNTGKTHTYRPGIEDHGHGGGDLGLTRQFVMACDRVKNHGWEAPRAQDEFIGCTLDEVLRSHAMVFAAEEARLGRKVLDWEQWWKQAVGEQLDSREA
ncbi:hypothetical protein NW754_016573 [Fusarium falciforme]|nr:hypothetical protein NW754_016573 [Fusarium falciforme]